MCVCVCGAARALLAVEGVGVELSARSEVKGDTCTVELWRSKVCYTHSCNTISAHNHYSWTSSGER